MGKWHDYDQLQQDFDDEVEQDFEQVGTIYGTGKAKFVSNKIGFIQDETPQIELHVVYDASDKKANTIHIGFAIEVNGYSFHLYPKNRKTANELARTLYDVLGDTYFEK